jgi:hypothetical protein
MKRDQYTLTLVAIFITVLLAVGGASWAVSSRIDKIKDMIYEKNNELVKEIGNLSGRVGSLETIFLDIKKSPVSLNKAITNLKEYAYKNSDN